MIYDWLDFEIAQQHMRKNLDFRVLGEDLLNTGHQLSRLIFAKITGGKYLLVGYPHLDPALQRDLRCAGTYQGKSLRDFYSANREDFLNDVDLPRLLGRFIEKSGGSVVTENPYMRRSDPCVDAIESKHVFLGNDVYHFANTNDSDAIKTVLRDSELPPFLTGLCSCVKLPDKAEFNSVSDLVRLVDSLAMVFTSALDGEGYLLWSPSDDLIALLS